MPGSKPELLITLPTRPDAMARLEDAFETHHLWRAADPEALLDEVAGRIRGVATTGERGLSAAEIAMMPGLEIVACFGVGVDAIDLNACAARQIPVTNTPDVLSKDVADLGTALILATFRRVVEADRYVRAQRWCSQGPMRLGRRLAGAKLGILGMGRIGAELAKRAAVFDLEVGYHNRRERTGSPHRYFADLVKMAGWADVLAVTTPGGAATRHLVDATVLDALGPDGFLINVARGSVVDQDALIRALSDGRIAGAGLDVFADEPEVPIALTQMEQVILQPHQASATVETRDAMANLVVDNLIAHFAGKPLLTRFER